MSGCLVYSVAYLVLDLSCEGAPYGNKISTNEAMDIQEPVSTVTFQ